MRRELKLWLLGGVTFGCVLIFHQFQLLRFQPMDVEGIGAMLRECSQVEDTSNSSVPMMSDILGIPGDRDEFGETSRFPSPASIIGKLIKDGKFGHSTAPPYYAVNFGARDGKGQGGNTDPTWELFKDQGFHGLAVEADGVFWTDLNKNLKGLPVNTTLVPVVPENAVAIIREKGLHRVDVFKIDIDSWDCSVLPAVLNAFHPSVAIVEYNLYFPPPIKMVLDTPVSEFNHKKRSKVYECSLQFQNDDVMQPAGYALAQVDWQNALYLRHDVAELVGVGKRGVDVQAAYQNGYVRQPSRTKHIPWASDVVHFIALRDYGKMMRAVLEWFKTPKEPGKQKGKARIGCGTTLVRIRET